MNPLQALYDDFNSGDPAEKLSSLPKFPRLLDVEITNACNFRCNFCPTGLGLLERRTGFMSLHMWKQIVDECGQHGTAVRIIGWGEGTLHPDIATFVLLASTRGIMTHINTNASKMTPDLAQRLVEAGLSSIKFSFQGVDRESYNEARQTDFFDGMMNAIKIMRDTRGDNPLPYIAASTSITNETPDQVERFRAIMEPLVDHLSIGHTTFDFLDGHAHRLRPHQRALFEKASGLDTTAKKHPVPCPEVYGKLSISWDGYGRVCCNDWNGETNLGRVGWVTIAKMWEHTTIKAYRERLSRGEYSGPLCSGCYDYAELTKGENT